MVFLDRLTSTRSTRSRASIAVESLETKALMATTSTAAVATGFTAPDLSGLVSSAEYLHQNTGPATIKTMETALQSQLTNGVLTALQGGTLIPADYQTSVSNVVTSYETNVDQQLLPRFKNIDAILKGQAQSALALVNTLTLQLNDGLITATQYNTEAAQGINAITGGPLYPVNSTYSGYATATTALETQLNLLPPTLATGASPSLTLAQAQAIAISDANTYQVALNTALFNKPTVAGKVNTAISTFETSVNAITTTGTTTPAQQLTAAITALDTALLDSTGLFGAKGLYHKYYS